MPGPLRTDLHEANRLSWNAATVAHNSHKGDQAAFFRGGGSTLFPEELELLGPLAGRTLVHLQCNAGQDTLSLARRGAEATGVDPSQFLQVIEGGPLGLPYAQMKGQMMIEEEYPTNFSASLARKDASLVLDAAQASGLRLPMTEAAATHFDEAIDAGHGGEDMAAVYQAARPGRG